MDENNLICPFCSEKLAKEYEFKNYYSYSCKKKIKYCGKPTFEYSVCFEHQLDGTIFKTEYFYNEVSEICVAEDRTDILIEYKFFKEIDKPLNILEIKEWLDRLKKTYHFK